MRPEGERPAKLGAAALRLAPLPPPLAAALLSQTARLAAALARLASPLPRPLGRRRRRGGPPGTTGPRWTGQTTPPQAVTWCSLARTERAPPAAQKSQPVQMSESSSGLS